METYWLTGRISDSESVALSPVPKDRRDSDDIREAG